MMPHGAGLVALAEGALLVVGGASIWAGDGDEDEGESEGGRKQTSGYSEEVDVIADGRRDTLNEERRSPPVEIARIDVIDGEGGDASTETVEEQETQKTERERSSNGTTEEQTAPGELADIDVIEDKEGDNSSEEEAPSIEFAGIDAIDDGDSESIDNPERGQNSKDTEKRQESIKTEGGETTASKFASRGAVSAVATEITRRAGIDRHAEAGLAEDLHAEAYARKVGGSVVSDSTSVFTPDGGVDKIVMTPDGEKAIQSKHYGSEVGEAVLQRYDPEVDVFASTRGISDSVDPSKYDSEIVTSKDWPISARARLEGQRVKRGIHRGLKRLGRSAAGVTRRVADGGKYALKQLLGGAKLARRVFSSAVTRTIGMLARQPRVTQGIMAVIVAGTLWLLWRKRTGKYTKQDLKKWLAVVGFLLGVLAVKRWLDNRR